MSSMNKTYIVSGGSGGIGLATVKRLAARGARVVVADLEEPIEPIVDDHVRFRACDVTKRDQVREVVRGTVEEFGVPDGVVTSAGIDCHHRFLDLDDAEFARVLDVNVLGSFRFVQECARYWVDVPRTAPENYAAVLLSSVNAVIATPTHTAYATSKGAVAQLVRVLAIELAPFGVRVNAMAPGTVRTRLLEKLSDERPEAAAAILSRTPMGRFAEPSEIAGGIEFLLSEAASYLTGQSLYADGGRTIQNLAL